MFTIQIRPVAEPECFKVVVLDQTVQEACGRCSGRGKHRLAPCLFCDGKGLINVRRDETVASYSQARTAKAFRNALDWALNEHGMNPVVAMTYAEEKARDEVTAQLETDAPDEHFSPA